jgi:hypothetical protein
MIQALPYKAAGTDLLSKTPRQTKMIQTNWEKAKSNKRTRKMFKKISSTTVKQQTLPHNKIEGEHTTSEDFYQSSTCMHDFCKFLILLKVVSINKILCFIGEA